MNPRLSLQGRVSLDGWGNSNRAEEAPLVGRHRRSHSNSMYRSQTLFNAFEEGEGVEDGTDAEAVGLHQLREEDEEEDEDADERTHLRSTELQQQQKHKHGSRSHSHSPVTQDDTRILPHPT
jgi:magnesium transporter